jgi:predicted HicB family RNase H-like nuclease
LLGLRAITSFMARPSPNCAALVAAQASGKRLNQWAKEVIRSAAHARNDCQNK